LLALVEPLLDVLALLHAENCLHRDVAPDNILLLGGDGPQPKPLLLDFGAARRVIGEQSQALTVILKPGFAPIEQYDETAGLKQGPWTDIYALAAVLHAAITGKPPPQAVGRLLQDSYEPLIGLPTRLGRYSDQFLAAVDRALAPLPHDRPQDVAAWRVALGLQVRTQSTTSVITPNTRRIDPLQPAALAVASRRAPAPVHTGRRSRATFWVCGGLCLVLAMLIIGRMHRKEDRRDALSAPAGVVEAARPADEPESVASTPNWAHESLREARQCLVAKRYTCTIERAEEVLKTEPTHPLALRLARLGREAMQGTPAGGRKKL